LLADGKSLKGNPMRNLLSTGQSTNSASDDLSKSLTQMKVDWDNTTESNDHLDNLLSDMNLDHKDLSLSFSQLNESLVKDHLPKEPTVHDTLDRLSKSLGAMIGGKSEAVDSASLLSLSPADGGGLNKEKRLPSSLMRSSRSNNTQGVQWLEEELSKVGAPAPHSDAELDSSKAFAETHAKFEKLSEARLAQNHAENPSQEEILSGFAQNQSSELGKLDDKLNIYDDKSWQRYAGAGDKVDPGKDSKWIDEELEKIRNQQKDDLTLKTPYRIR